MDRTETLVIDVAPERRPVEVRLRQQFGWQLITSQADSKLIGGTAETTSKLLFTRTGSDTVLRELRALEEELAVLERTVVLDERGIVLVGERPSRRPPFAIVGAAAVSGGLLVFMVSQSLLAIAGAAAGGGVAWRLLQPRAEARYAAWEAASRKATDAFGKRRNDILFRARTSARALPQQHPQ